MRCSRLISTFANMHVPIRYLLRKAAKGELRGASMDKAHHHQWLKGWYVLQDDALRAFDSEEFVVPNSACM